MSGSMGRGRDRQGIDGSRWSHHGFGHGIAAGDAPNPCGQPRPGTTTGLANGHRRPRAISAASIGNPPRSPGRGPDRVWMSQWLAAVDIAPSGGPRPRALVWDAVGAASRSNGERSSGGAAVIVVDVSADLKRMDASSMPAGTNKLSRRAARSGKGASLDAQPGAIGNAALALQPERRMSDDTRWARTYCCGARRARNGRSAASGRGSKVWNPRPPPRRSTRGST
jgi:hypothetical protein